MSNCAWQAAAVPNPESAPKTQESPWKHHRATLSRPIFLFKVAEGSAGSTSPRQSPAFRTALRKPVPALCCKGTSVHSKLAVAQECGPTKTVGRAEMVVTAGARREFTPDNCRFHFR